MKTDSRTNVLVDGPVKSQADYVLYWMSASRRARSNFALDRAIAWATSLHKPLVVLEALDYAPAHASQRLHRFVVEGMEDNAAEFEASPVHYIPWVAPKPGMSRPLLRRLADDACVVVVDEMPTRAGIEQRAAAAALSVHTESVDSCGLLPLSRSEKPRHTAYAFRRFLQGELMSGWSLPAERPLTDLRLPRLEAAPVLGSTPPGELLATNFAGMELDEVVEPSALVGGPATARATAELFVEKICDYATARNHPDRVGTSLLSPYLHFGHIAATDVVQAVLAPTNFDVDKLGAPDGSRTGWWGVDEGTEAFLDQLVTWRELAHHFAHLLPDHAEYSSLPPWARETLDRHRDDPREHIYSLEELETANTADEVWNAAQTELRRSGMMHNYMRMLWGKKLLAWSATPEEAFDRAIYLNDRWALDGRDPNSYAGIGWVFGRFDRPWGPRRDVFGTVRYMTSASAKRKLRLKRYLAENGPANGLLRLSR